MFLRVDLPGYRGRTPRSVGAYGYGCRVDRGSLRCELVSVHHSAAAGVVVSGTLDGRPIRVVWAGLPPGIHVDREVGRAAETHTAAG